MNWGWSLVLVMLGFIGFMAYFFIRAMGQEDELVVKNYYQEEYEISNRKEKLANAEALGESVKLDWSSEENKLEIGLPSIPDSASLLLFRPSKAALDKSLDLEFANGATIDLDLSNEVEGFWKVSLLWHKNDSSFQKESSIYIGK